MLQHLSLTARLTLFFTIMAGVVVFGVGLLFMHEADQHFIDLDRMTLLDKQHLIEEILKDTASPKDLRWRLREALSHHHGLFSQVKDPSSAIIFESKDFISVPKTSEDNTLLTWKNEGIEFRAIRSQFLSVTMPASAFEITVALDTQHHQHFLNDLQRSFAIYAVLATLISGLLGWWAAHQGMAPLRAMKLRAAGVSGQQLDARMPIAAVPVEMADLARALNKMFDRLQEDFRRLSEFSSDLAHELRTPISNLLTQTEVTLNSEREGAVYRDILASNTEELQRLSRMVSDMLFLAKTEQGSDLLHKEQFSAAKEVQALLDFYEVVAEEQDIHLSSQGEGRLFCDRLMFRRALSNLLSNALRHTPTNGDVVVDISATERMMQIMVINTGSAIDPTVIHRLFDRFFRADPARTHLTSDSTGLGLSITKAIVDAHGGTISVQSDSTSTRFSMTFPH